MRPRIIVHLIFWVFCFTTISTHVSVADEPTGDTSSSPADKQSSKSQSLLNQFPDQAPDGRPLRVIGLFQSQLVELIPNDFIPVTVEKLNVMMREFERKQSPTNTPQIHRAYLIARLRGDTLVSERSTLDIRYDGDTPAVVSMSKVNVAVDPLLTRHVVTNNSLPRFEANADGTLNAVVDGDATMSFYWSLRGKDRGDKLDLELQVPRASQTQIEIATPLDTRLESLDGVLTALAEAPLNANNSPNDAQTRWWRIDAGGLDRVRLLAWKDFNQVENEALIVRRHSTQFEVNPSGIDWTYRMTVQQTKQDILPSFAVRNGTILGLSVDGIGTSFRTLARNRTGHVIELIPPSDTSIQAGIPVTITVNGFSNCDLSSEWTPLPHLQWLTARTLFAATTSQAQLKTAASVQLLEWKLPPHWRKSVLDSSSEGYRFVQAEGPPPETIPTLAAGISRQQSPESFLASEPVPVSALRLAVATPVQSYEALLALRANEDSLDARARITMSIADNSIDPIQVALQRGWNVLSVSIPESGRIIELPTIDPERGIVTIWPEQEDIVDGQLMLDMNGRYRTSNDQGHIVPASWFVRVAGARGRLTAAVSLPPTLKWSGDTSLRLTRLSPTVLTSDEISFLGPFSTDTLLMRPEIQHTPQLLAQRPQVSFQIASRFELEREGNEFAETLRLKLEGTSSSVDLISVVTGEAQGRPPFHWSIDLEDDTAPILLPAISTRWDDKDPLGVYTINCPTVDTRGKSLVGRRRYERSKPLEIVLPRVPDAISQNAEAVIGPGIELIHRSASVMQVPTPVTDVDPTMQPSATLASREHWGATSTRLRYDPVDQPSITVAPSQTRNDVNVIWNKRVRVIASSRGMDVVELTMNISSVTPIVIRYSPELRLTEIQRDGKNVPKSSNWVDRITLTPSMKSEALRVTWTRNKSLGGWWRFCLIPEIKTDGTVADERACIAADGDSFIPAALWLSPYHADSSTVDLPVSSNSRIWLVHENMVLALGTCFAFVIFAVCWWCAIRSATFVAGFLVLATSIAVLWSQWSLAVIGWWILPTTGALTFVTARNYREYWLRNTGGTRFGETARATTAQSRRSSSEMSIRLPLPSIVWWVALTCLAWLASRAAAEIPLDKLPDGPITILVPTSIDGEMLGDRVYIPKHVHAAWDRTAEALPLQPVRFQFADYRLRLEPTRDQTNGTGHLLIAEYVVRLDQASNFVELPLIPEAVRRVELIGQDDDRIVRFAPRGPKSIVVTVPPATLLRLRVTLNPTLNVTPQESIVSVEVPIVASARLTVDVDRAIESLSIDGSAGRVFKDLDMRRIIADLGPIDRIAVRYSAGDQATQTTTHQSITRQYWIHCGRHQTLAECVITPNPPVPIGKSIELLVQGSTIPILESPHWRMAENDSEGPSRRSLTFTSLAESSSPIRLIWMIQSELSDPAKTDERTMMNIPEVTLKTNSEPVTTQIALTAEPGIRIQPKVTPGSEPLPVDQFLASWNGYHDRLDLALVVKDRLPQLGLIPTEAPISQVSAYHQLRVTATQLRLHYQANMTLDSSTLIAPILKIPKNMELISLTINGVPITNAIATKPDAHEVLLSPWPKGAPVQVSAIAVAPLSRSGRFSPPRLEILPTVPTSETYVLVRDAATRVRSLKQGSWTPVDPPSVEGIASIDIPATNVSRTETSNVALLAAGWLPLSTWRLELPAAGFDTNSLASEVGGGLFEATAQQKRCNITQLVRLSWQAGRWSMQSHIQFDPGKLPDYVDIEVPARWSDSLEVTPALTWSQQPAMDPQSQVIRVRLGSEDADRQLSIRGLLKDNDKGRVSVPAVTVLGPGARRVWVSVPNRLTNEAIRWRTSAVTLEALPTQWQPLLSGESSQQSAFYTRGTNWSIELSSLPRPDAHPSITSAETQVYLSNQSALLHARFDVAPAGLTSLGILLPKHATLVGAWSAGHPASVKQDPAAVLIPLTFDRLSQSIEVLYRLPVTNLYEQDYLARIADVESSEHWVRVFMPASIDGSKPESINHQQKAFRDRVQQSTFSAYAYAQAESIVKGLERSFDNLAERPADEVSTWLIPWITRYHALSGSVGRSRPAKIVDANTSPEPATPEGRWMNLDNRIGTLANRFLATDVHASNQEHSPFGVLGLAQYDEVGMIRLKAGDAAPGIQPRVDDTQSLRVLISNLLSLLMVCAMLGVIRPLRTRLYPLIHHPATWLGVLGICACFLAPIPIAATLLLVALVTPIYPWSRLIKTNVD